jgi:hypothetical protein
MEVEGTRHHMSWISAEMMKQRNSGPYENYGEMLYAESLEGIARRRQKAERELATRAEAELSSATFQPEISRLAQQLWSRQDGSTVPAWQRLSKSAWLAGGECFGSRGCMRGPAQHQPPRPWC